MNTSETEKDSEWQKTPYANLVRYKSSGIYFARFRVRGKLIRRSLKTTQMSVAKLRLGDLEKQERQRADHQTAVADGTMTFADALAKRKDGTGVFVIVRHELALQPGLAVWEAFHDPKDGQVKLDGETVITFPKLTDFQQVTLKVLRWEERDKRLNLKDAELYTAS